MHLFVRILFSYAHNGGAHVRAREGTARGIPAFAKGCGAVAP
jgi:hypothetical protein